MAGSAPATSWLRVTTASRLTTPVMMIAASSIRDMTRPSAMAWFCRLTIGYRATAVPMPAMALTKSRKPAHEQLGVVPGDDGEVGVHRRSDQDEGGQRGGEGDQVEDAGGAGVVAGRVACRRGWRAVGRAVVVMTCLLCRFVCGSVGSGDAAASGSTWVTEMRGRPRSRSRCSSPCRAAWSTTGPRRVVVPSAPVVRVSPSNHADHRAVEAPLEADLVPAAVVRPAGGCGVHGCSCVGLDGSARWAWSVWMSAS